MTRMDKNEIYDIMCKALTNLETGEVDYDDAVDDLYQIVVRMQNCWEELTTASDNDNVNHSNTFVPRKVNNDEAKVRNWLLEGKVIRYNGESRLDMADRDVVPYLHSMRNIGYESCCTTLDINSSVAHNVVKKLKEEGYDVRKVFCNGSGCCQYATFAYYIAE